MRKALAGIAVVALATAGFTGTANAAPLHKEGTVWTCDGQETLIIEAGRNGWVDGVKYHAVYLEFGGTFTPVAGEPETESEVKVYGGGKGLTDPDRVECDTHFEETIPGEGTFVGDGFVIAVPA